MEAAEADAGQVLGLDLWADSLGITWLFSFVREGTNQYLEVAVKTASDDKTKACVCFYSCSYKRTLIIAKNLSKRFTARTKVCVL